MAKKEPKSPKEKKEKKEKEDKADTRVINGKQQMRRRVLSPAEVTSVPCWDT